MPIALDLTGHAFGRLTALARAERPEGARKEVYWSCRCICGNGTIVPTRRLTNGHTRSCGCLMLETAAEAGRKRRTHGYRGSPTYSTWISMRRRCYDPTTGCWADYGGRGITVHPRWDRFQNFLEDMGERPKGKTIDRIDNSGNYEPGNCRWATPKEQGQNKRSNQDPILCKNGHRWDAVGFRIDRSGSRVCRACMREHQRAYRRRKEGRG